MSGNRATSPPPGAPDHTDMETHTAPASHASGLREMLPMLVISAVILVLSSLDQSTRGPSITAMLLTQLNLVF